VCSGDLVAYLRTSPSEQLLVALNVSDTPVVFRSPFAARIELSTVDGPLPRIHGQEIRLRAREGIVCRLPSA
jgi:hypothetical protein